MANPIKLKIDNTPSPTIEIDMWNIEGEYADGKWHILIHKHINSWLKHTEFDGTGTLWSVVAGSVNFNHQGNSCFIAFFSLPNEFIISLFESLAAALPSQVGLTDQFIVKRADGWRPYLHIEQGDPCKPWEDEY